MRKLIACFAVLALGAGAALAETDYIAMPKVLALEKSAVLNTVEDQLSVETGTCTNGETVVFDKVFASTPAVVVFCTATTGATNKFASAVTVSNFVANSTTGVETKYLAIGVR